METFIWTTDGLFNVSPSGQEVWFGSSRVDPYWANKIQCNLHSGPTYQDPNSKFFSKKISEKCKLV